MLQHIYHANGTGHSDANELRLLGTYPNPPLALHWIPESLSLNMFSYPCIILRWSNILLHKGSSVCALFILSDIFRYA